MTDRIRLDAHIHSQGATEALASVLTVLGQTCVDISRVVSGGALSGALGASGQINVQDEEQKKLDVITNDMLRETLAACPAVAGVASEELDTVEPTGRDGAGRYLVLFDPLDGSSNIDINGSVGTIFSILPAPAGTVDEAAFFQIGRHQAAAGYVLYGAQTMMVLTIKDGVHAFTLSADGQWLLTQGDIAIPADTREFAINMSNRRHWAGPVRRYIDALLEGKTGPRAKDFNMRWIAAMVGDVHRILMRGGVFLYPWDQREPNRAGKLRLMYEGNPMALLIERAGGKATTDGVTSILDIQPTELHQRIPVVLGSANEVDQVAAA